MTASIEIDGKAVTVDEGIANVIIQLNRFGFKTISSCSSLREDHPDIRSRRERSVEAYVTVFGKHPELIDIAEQSGWDWWFNAKSYTKDGKTPLDHVDFYSSGGQVYKSVNTAREKRVHLFWREKRTHSSREEAIRYLLPVESTTLVLTTDELSTILTAEELVIPDQVIKKRIEALEKAITDRSDTVTINVGTDRVKLL